MWWDKQDDVSRCRVSKALISQGKESATERVPSREIGVAVISRDKGEKVR